jgi:membrane protease YdiL (CAAX protease family)
MNFGLLPSPIWHVVFPFAAIVLYFLRLQGAQKRKITQFYNSALAVSFWEEILFRGLVLGVILNMTQNVWWAIFTSSLLFGLFHLRNYWWADKKQLIRMCFYAGLIVGPLMGYARIITGDIYLGILLHFLNNFLVAFPPRMLKGMISNMPDDSYLNSLRK